MRISFLLSGMMLIIFLLISSCDDFLEKNPSDSLTEEQAFSTEENLQMYIYSFYQNMPTAGEIYGDGNPLEDKYWNGDNFSDITTVSYSNVYLIEGGWTSQDETLWTWNELRNINYFLAHYRQADVPEDKKNHYAGIARFFRAWFYFDKVKRYGDVPWYSQPLGTDDEELYKARDPRTLVMDSVLADINFAADYIDDKKDNTCSTITKWTALALKSRICLFEGTFRKYHTELGLTGTANNWLGEAVSAAEEIVASSNYSLYSTNTPDEDYRALFINETPKSAEIILAATYSNELQKWHPATSYFSNYGKYQESLLKRFINTYLNSDGSRFTDLTGYDTIQFQREVKNRDKRLYQTIRTPSYTRSDGSAAAPYLVTALSGYHLLKFSLDDPYYDTNDRGSNAIPIMRYAEVLLNLAEAKAEMGSFTESDWNETIGLIRKRAGISNTSMPSTLDPYMKNNFYDDVSSVAIMEIRRERTIELVAEAFRMDDLKRWKKGELLEKEYDGIYVPEMDQLLDLDENGNPDVAFVGATPASPVSGVYYYVIDNVSTKLSGGDKGRVLVATNLMRKWEDYKYYAPIPSNELVINENLVQNEGWE